ncbi:hypothetical protein Hdeb2414_s0022g00611441 [Helianthus debilis subsp. tardiflorus]
MFRNSYDVILFLSLMTDESISFFNSCLFTSCYGFSRIKALSTFNEAMSSMKETTEKLVYTNAELLRENQRLKQIMREMVVDCEELLHLIKKHQETPGQIKNIRRF